MQDGATGHTSNENTKIFEVTAPHVWGKGIWPGNSPELNPIEHVRSILQESVFKKPIPTDLGTLVRRLTEKWDSLNVTFLGKLTRSLPNRIREVQKSGGISTTY